jgi:hypothetical protein
VPNSIASALDRRVRNRTPTVATNRRPRAALHRPAELNVCPPFEKPTPVIRQGDLGLTYRDAINLAYYDVGWALPSSMAIPVG